MDEFNALGWTDDMLAVQERMIQMVDVYMRMPDSERRHLGDIKSSHPSTIADWMEHLAHADRPIDPVTGRPDKTQPRMRPAYPSSKEISRAMACDSWMGLYVVPHRDETETRAFMRRRVLRCVLIVKAKGANTVWPTVRAMLKLRFRQLRRLSDSTLRRDYRDAIADIAAGLRTAAAIAGAQKASRAVSRGAMVSRGQTSERATQRAHKMERVL